MLFTTMINITSFTLLREREREKRKEEKRETEREKRKREREGGGVQLYGEKVELANELRVWSLVVWGFFIN